MNDRFEKLVAEAFFDESTNGEGQKMYTFGDEKMQKFAELIVQECMCKIMQRKEEAIDNDWRVDEAMSAAISDISEHFGVEE